MSVMSWSSFRIKRVCRSTLSAEAQSACLGIEQGDYLKILLEEAFTAGFSLTNYQQRLKSRKGILVVDAKSLYDYLNRDTGRLPSDKRLGIDLRLVQSYLQQSTWSVRWVSGPQQLADSLTKEGEDGAYLKHVLKTGKFQLIRDEDLHRKVGNVVDKIQQRLVTEQLDPAEKTRQRSRRKGEKHRARVEAIRDRMNQETDIKKPSFYASNLSYAVFSALRSMVLHS
jgi:hypothetical protein